MLTKATEQNLKRKAHWADRVQLHNGVPLWSWLDISPIDACNRACVFCPRVDPAVAPNNPKLVMSMDLAIKIAAELHELNYEGAIIFCGTGEPLLHPYLADIVDLFEGMHVEVVTNGDPLSTKSIRNLRLAGVSFFAVSMYDGPHQVDKFKQMFFDADCIPNIDYILRDRWYGPDEDYGVKLTNRAGTINVGHQPKIDVNSSCYYPDYCLTLDWNGDALLCPQDWHRRVKFGNVHDQSLLDIWTSQGMRKRRTRLKHNREGLIPCQTCNANGCLHGADHLTAWEQVK